MADSMKNVTFVLFEESVTELFHKLPKEMVVYVQGDGKIFCKSCKYFVAGVNKCTVVAGEIKPKGTCDFWTPGPNAMERDLNPHRPKQYFAGYIERENGTSCGRCKYFKPKTNECRLTEGHINAQDCCNLWDD